MKSLGVLIVFACAAMSTDAARILAMFPYQVKSHYAVYEPMLKRLAEKGHEVVSVSHFPQKVPLPNFTDVDISSSVLNMVTTKSFKFLDVTNNWTRLKNLLTRAGAPSCKSTFEHLGVNTLIQSKPKFDVYIVEIFTTDCYLIIAHTLKIPTVVGAISSVTLPWANEIVGNPDNPSYIPNWLNRSSDRMNFYERLVNFLYYLYTEFMYRYASTAPSNKIIKEYFGEDLPDLDTLRSNISLIFTNGHRAISSSRPLAPGLKELGGMHIPSSGPKPLPENLQKYLDSQDKHGVIYFSLGSVVDMSTMPKEALNAFLKAFDEVPQQVLLKCPDSKALGLPEKIKCVEWMPQFSVLCHPNVRLFITHGGLLGTQEAVYCGVPILGMPLFGDQHLNVAYFVKKGLAQRLNYHRLSYELVSNALNELLGNKSYKEAAQKASLEFKDNPIPPLEEAVYWIEYLLRHGPDSLRPESINLTWYQYLLLDIIFVIILSLFLLLWIVYKLLKLAFRRNRYPSVSINHDKKQR